MVVGMKFNVSRYRSMTVKLGYTVFERFVLVLLFVLLCENASGSSWSISYAILRAIDITEG